MKKKLQIALWSVPHQAKKIFLVMRLTLFLVLLFFATANAFTQKISLSVQSTTLNEVLRQIKDQTGVRILYNAGLAKQVHCKNLVIDNLDVEAALQKALEGTSFNFFEESGVYIIREITTASQPEVIRISGVVTDKNKQPMPGVTVAVIFAGEKSGNLGTATDVNGVYRLNLPPGIAGGFSLKFTFIGMEPAVVKYTGQEKIDVSMKLAKEELEEVIVTGYANVRKESFTGNATTVTKEQLLKTNNKSLISALQAFDPSFRIKENSTWGSDPNALPEFNIRGEGSIAMKKGLDEERLKRTQRTNLRDNPNLPIFILDGFEASVEKIFDMDMNRVESATILKDAAATALYGSRAANGVVVVTTVAPKPGEIRISYNFNGGVELPDLSDYNLCNAREKLEIEALAGLYKGSTDFATADKQQEYHDKLNNILRGVNTDWLAMPLRNVFNHMHSLNIQGGTENIRYGIDMNYNNYNGAMKGSFRNRAGVGLTLDFRPKPWLQILNHVTYNSTRSKDSPYGNFSDYGYLQPYNAIYDENGELMKEMVDDKVNPLWRVQKLESFAGKGGYNELTNNLSMNLFFNNGLQFKGQFSITKEDSKSETFKDPKDPEFDGAKTDQEKGTLARSLGSGYNWNLNVMLYYNKSIQKHFINATLGVNMMESDSEDSQMLFKGFQIGTLNTPAFAASQPNKTDVSTTASRLIGILASLNYSYNDVYLLDASFRLDGSSQFGEKKRFAPFWSVGTGINIHNYDFLKGNPVLSRLKLRGTYGITGKVDFPAYSAVTTYMSSSDSWYATGPAAGLVYLGNPNLTWETTGTLDVGIVLGFFNDKLYLEGNYYNKKTDSLLSEMGVQTSSGFDKYYTNVGAIVNRGYELKLNATLYSGQNWTVSVNANMAGNKNEITELGEEMKAYNQKLLDNYDAKKPEYPDLVTTPLIQYYVGASTSAVYAVRSAGIDPSNGKELFMKKEGQPTYIWCADDQVVVGDESPSAQGSLGINVGYRGFYLNASFMYQWGSQTYNKTLINKVENADIANANVDKRVLTERWIKPGDAVPYYDMKERRETKPTSRFVQDYNFLSFSGFSCGYDFRKDMIQRFYLTSLGIRFNANDLCRWSSVKEERGTAYPYAKNYSFTLSLGF